MIANLAKILLALSFIGLIWIILTKIKVLVVMPDICCKGCNRINKFLCKAKDSVSKTRSLSRATFKKILNNFLSKFRKVLVRIERKTSSKLHDMKTKEKEEQKEEIKRNDRDYWEKLKDITKKN